MLNDEQPCVATPVLIYCTVDGSIGVIATLNENDYEFLKTLESVMANIVPYSGDLTHKE